MFTCQQGRRASFQLCLLPLQSVCDLLVLMDEVRRGIPPGFSVLCNLRDEHNEQSDLRTSGPLRPLEQKWMLLNTQKYLPLYSLFIIVEEAEAVEFVLWRRVVGLTAPAAPFLFGFRSGRWSLIQTQAHTRTRSEAVIQDR